MTLAASKLSRNHVSLPQCSLEFRLQTLSVSLFYGTTPVEELRRSIRQLYSGLRSLNLAFQHAMEVFFERPILSDDLDDSSDLDDEMAPLPSKRSKNAADDDMKGLDSFQSPLDMSSLFPNLEAYSDICAYSGEEFSKLPRNLRSFSCHSISKDAPAECFKDLPPNLTSFSVTSSLSPQKLDFLPKSLTYLSHQALDSDGVAYLAQNPHVLPNLVEFPYDNGRHLKPEEWAGERLPVNILSLSTYNLSPDRLFPIIPQYLLLLRTAGSSSPLHISAQHICTYLPKSLTTFEVEALDWSDISSNIWPTSLTRFRIFNDSAAGPAHFHRLPRTLLYLTINAQRSQQAPTTQEMSPEEEASLRALGQASIAGPDRGLWNRLKHSLISRTIDPFTAAEEYIDQVEKGGLYGLPLSLLELTLCHYSGNIPNALLIPPQVNTLYLYYERPLTQSTNFFGLLPPSLTTTSVLQLTTPSSWDVFRTGAAATSPLRNSTRLVDISWMVDEEIEPYLDFLPRNLRNLKILSDQTLTEEALSKLPLHLESLTVSLKAMPLDPGRWLSALPRSLLHLRVSTPYGTWFEGEHVHFFPPRLESLVFCVRNLKLEHFWSLPRTLRVVANDRPNRTMQALSKYDATGVCIFEIKTVLGAFWRIWSAPDDLARLVLERGKRLLEPMPGIKAMRLPTMTELRLLASNAGNSNAKIDGQAPKKTSSASTSAPSAPPRRSQRLTDR